MFRKTFLCSLACAAAISGVGANNSASAAGSVAARVASGTAGVVLTGNSVINFLQWFKVGTDKEGKENEGVLGRKGAIGQFDHVSIQKGKEGSWKGLTTSIVKGVLGLGGIVGSILPF